jgi:hypothetical protein
MEDARMWARAGFVSIAAFARLWRPRCVLSIVFRFLGPRLVCCILTKLLSS